MNAQPISIGLIQSKVSRNIQDNLDKTIDKIKEAANKGAQIICLQELFKTLYFPQDKKMDASTFAESIPGETTELLSKLAYKLDIVLIAPLYEKDSDGNYFNSAAVIDADGKLLGTYRKNHIPFDPYFYEKNYFEEGNKGYPVFHTKFATISALICYDQWFPEAARSCALKGADIIFYPTAIGYIKNEEMPEGDWHDAWETIQCSHSIANCVHIAAVNRVGNEGELEFWGGSFVSDSFGNVIKKASRINEDILITEVDISMNKKIQQEWGFLKNRRQDTYGK